MTMATPRPNAADVKVICIGLARTGTMSLRDALATLGFGPCYHVITIVEHNGEDLPTWSRIGDGKGTPEDFDTLLRGYGSILDYPAAMNHVELYEAYPDAKFILTTRDPAKWEKSMKATILALYRGQCMEPDRSPLAKAMSDWTETYAEKKYHRGRLETHTQQEFLDHTERVKRNIPADQLLVYEVGEGWDRLVEFLGVPKPQTPFSHINSTAKYQENYMEDYMKDLPTES